MTCNSFDLRMNSLIFFPSMTIALFAMGPTSIIHPFVLSCKGHTQRWGLGGEAQSLVWFPKSFLAAWSMDTPPGPSPAQGPRCCCRAYLEGPGWWSRACTRWTLSSASRSSARAPHTGTRRWPGCRTGPGCSTCPSLWQRCSPPGPGGTGGSPPLGTWWWTWLWPHAPSTRRRRSSCTFLLCRVWVDQLRSRAEVP